VRLKHGDGSADLGEDLEVDAIIVTAGTAVLPTSLLRHLKPGGRMVIPLAQHADAVEGVQRLTVVTAREGGYREQTYDAVRFVPLLHGLG
jgi:protein-L-isoaspartate(D-aspartate) O-methyltransferase